jgi:hydroxymethylpyrimidine pyrophosphatase-like HAD family hydrolase
MKNKELGLPHSVDGKMEKVLIAFDVDGTLVDTNGESSATMVVLQMMLAQKWKNVDVIVWSGGGAEYARTMMERKSDFFRGRNIWHSKLEHTELRKKYAKIIAIDDIQDTRLGDVNLIVRNK